MKNSLRFPAKMRLRLDRDFRRVYAGKQRVELGFLTIYALRNSLSHTRIGVSLPRKVGTAVRRNRIKRLLREGFRLWQKQLPTCLDVVIVVRPHEPKQLKEYQDALMDAGIEAKEVTHIKAHATGSTYNDLAEGRGLRAVFEELPEIFVLKAAVGHTLGACGALELALLYGTLREGFIPKTGGFETIDSEMEIVPSHALSEISEGYLLLNHFGFAGSGVVLVIEYTQGRSV